MLITEILRHMETQIQESKFVSEESSSVKLRIRNNKLELYQFIVPEAMRGRRIGSLLLDEICNMADLYNVGISVNVIPGTRGLTYRQLIKWYEKRGFLGTPPFLSRNPKKFLGFSNQH